MSQIISIEGNIGSGKSTLLKHLKNYITDLENNKLKNTEQHLDIECGLNNLWDLNFKSCMKCNDKKIIFLQEPVDEWMKIKDNEGKDILTKFYEDPVKYSFAFQIMAYISRLSILKKCIEENPDAIIITERCLNTDRYVFAKMLYDDGKLNEVEYQIYLKWFDDFIDLIKIQKTVYLKTEPEICHQRISIRNRGGEENISIDYLKKCHLYHEEMISKNSLECLIINSNIDYTNDSNIIKEWIEKIDTFISS